MRACGEPTRAMAVQRLTAAIDCRCRLSTNATGTHVYGPSIFEAGGSGDVAPAWAAVQPGFDAGKFVGWVCVYDWGQGLERERLLAEWTGCEEGRQ